MKKITRESLKSLKEKEKTIIEKEPTIEEVIEESTIVKEPII